MKTLPILLSLSFLLVGCHHGQLEKDISIIRSSMNQEEIDAAIKRINQEEYVVINKEYMVKLQDLREIGWVRKGRYLYNTSAYDIKFTRVYIPLIGAPQVTLRRDGRRVVLFGNEEVLFSIMRSYQ